MKNKIITIVAFLAVIVALTGLASAFDVEFLKPDGTKTNPVYMRNGENFNLNMQLNNLRPQDINLTSVITKLYSGCTNETGGIENCAETDIDVTLLKQFFTVTAVPTTLQNDTSFVGMNAPLERKPGTQYSFVVFVAW